MSEKNLWKLPPAIKVYEALGAIGDNRIELLPEHKAKVWSSSGNKYYDVVYDPDKNQIMTNDNGSYWQGYLGYPAIAYLIKIKKINIDEKIPEALQAIQWKDINTKFKNDWDKTTEFIHQLINERKFSLEKVIQQIQEILDSIDKLKVSKLGRRLKPPKGY